MNPQDIIRPEIAALSAYHVQPASGFIKLDAMENPYAFPEALRSGLRYLAIVMDQYSRCVILHSDRGTQYLEAPIGDCIRQFGFLQSAGVRGPGDNAHAESFFHSWKRS